MKSNVLKLTLGALFLSLPNWAQAGGGINALGDAYTFIATILLVIVLAVPLLVAVILAAVTRQKKGKLFGLTLLVGYGMIGLFLLGMYAVYS
jgi:hypothetical protein